MSAVESLLTDLRDRAAAATGAASAQVWDGAWHALESPRRISLRTPAVLVALLGWELAQVPLADAGVRGLLDAAPDEAPAPQLRGSFAVTVVTGGGTSDFRAMQAASLAARAVPACVEAALTRLRGAALYSEALTNQGLCAYSVLGDRTFEAAAAPPPGPGGRPDAVDLVLEPDGRPKRVWPE